MKLDLDLPEGAGPLDPAFRFPLGFEQRQVAFSQNGAPGLRQQAPMQMKRNR